MPTNISIKIDQALYGIGSKTIDVTKEAQDALMGDDITISAKRLGVDDPAPGEVKIFAVSATVTVDGESSIFNYIGKDYETVDFIP